MIPEHLLDNGFEKVNFKVPTLWIGIPPDGVLHDKILKRTPVAQYRWRIIFPNGYALWCSEMSLDDFTQDRSEILKSCWSVPCWNDDAFYRRGLENPDIDFIQIAKNAKQAIELMYQYDLDENIDETLFLGNMGDIKNAKKKRKRRTGRHAHTATKKSKPRT